jgi:hypothetical protein
MNAHCVNCLKIFHNYWMQHGREIKNFDLHLIVFQYSISRQLIGEESSKLTALIYLDVQDFTKLKKEVNCFFLIVWIGLVSSVFIFLSFSLHNPYSMRLISLSFSKNGSEKFVSYIISKNGCERTFSISCFPWHVSVTSNRQQADISVRKHDMFSVTVALNMSCPCTEMSAWW